MVKTFIVVALLILAWIVFRRVRSARFLSMNSKKFGPRIVEIAGIRVPVLVGESAPESAAGREQISVKRFGVLDERFAAMEDEQLAAVKAVIRRIAQQASGVDGPMNEEPDAAMDEASRFVLKQQLHENWLAKGLALKRVANVLHEVTKGTPTAYQPPELEPIPTLILGSYFLENLKKLADDGTLKEAFTYEEGKNLQQTAMILDRIQRNPSTRLRDELLYYRVSADGTGFNED
jgi:hypothetical protein